tara:strand:- start:30799 stop:31350 length:552 start_codon:yes stop_codon:yes gene_type:complete
LQAVLELARHEYVELFVVRIDLHFSQRFDLPDIAITNQPVCSFFKKLKEKLKAKEDAARLQTGRANLFGLRYVWAREIGPESGVPHYHLMLVFNQNAIRSLGDFSNPNAPGLYRLCQEAWADAIGLDFDLASGLVSSSPSGQWLLRRDDTAVFDDVFRACSYLCKARSKIFELGFHGFGFSRR